MFDESFKGKTTQLVTEEIGDEDGGGIEEKEKYIENRLADSTAELEEMSLK